MPYKLSIKDKNQLLEKFKALHSLKEKISFWEDKLKCKYYVFYMNTSNSAARIDDPKNYNEFMDFRILPKPDENLEFNNYILNSYKEAFQFQKSRLFNYEDMQQNFEEKLAAVENKKEFINSEIENVKELVSNLRRPNLKGLLADTSHTFFKHTYDEYYLNNKSINWGKQPIGDIENLIAYANGETQAKYLKFIMVALETVNSKAVANKSESLSVDEQYLVLDYLGFFDKAFNEIETSQKKARLLSLIISKSEQNIRDLLSHTSMLKQTKTISDKGKLKKKLEKIYSLFQEVGLKSAQKKVKKDLQSLS